MMMRCVYLAVLTIGTVFTPWTSIFEYFHKVVAQTSIATIHELFVPRSHG